MDLDEKSRINKIFMADVRSKVAYEDFGDVVTFDTSYLTNKYDIPFATFVGVNHHGQSTFLGCVLLSNEDTNTFVWLFKSWLACMSNCSPCAIITDQYKAMQNAIEITLPHTKHRWFLWHILKKLPEKVKGYTQYHSIKSSLSCVVYDSITKNEFEECWNEIIENFAIGDDTKCNIVLEMIHHLKTKLLQVDDVCEKKEETKSHVGFSNEISQGCRVHDPCIVRSKGRPPIKRKQSKVEQIIRRKRQKIPHVDSKGQNTKKASKKIISNEMENISEISPMNDDHY
ncbi:protein FAR1-RELATED SEQUENCE 6-like [Humulus lupulus]|uniref:protein FAR1-RELATED SEQUENCE 6-like n=1 Tax=Humulus lupulus TaxID=3486 RepID=UPI002B4038F2|nr:protein FAR1-RELATED SEQUENCE 6-like [Humulus lupulus]